MKKPFYITTPIYYASGDLHLGHCVTSVYVDTIARFKRMSNFDVMFLTGSDEHGQKVEQKAKEAGMNPQEYVDKLDLKFKDLWKLLNISYDKYIRTTDENHVKTVQKIFTKLYENGDIYKGEYEGLYCTPCESFFTESQLIDGKCPDCGREVVKTKEEAYFFKLSKYQKQIEDYYENHPDFIRLDATRKEMVNGFIKPGLQDLCVSRTSFKWGVPVEFDKNHVVYVWIDALTNYITALGYLQEDDSLFKKFWPADFHIMAKEIVRFHIIIWPAILMALNLPLPKQIHAHGWLTKAGTKMGKSLGNGFNPYVLCERYGVDSVRYFLIKNGPIMQDAPYDNELFLNTINSDLCNELGNLLSRTTAMLAQNFEGVLPKVANTKENEFDSNLINVIESAYENVEKYINSLDINLAVNEIFKIVRSANKYIDETTPWKLKENKERLAVVLHNLYFALFSVATFLKAFLPQTSEKILNQLGMDSNNAVFENITNEFNLKIAGNQTFKGEALFARLDVNKEIEFLLSGEKKMEEVKVDVKEEIKEEVKEIKGKPEITYDDFDKCEFRVGKILEAEKVEGADRLLKFKVKIGDEERTIISGVAPYYTPEYMVNKSVVVVVNLKPRKIRGIESKGMILYACDETEENLCFVTPEKEMESGVEVC
ncbi:MAG: methionine--tRNA ligase [Clostridiales bacterium]|nr:methionine--tRNA ligase [Clostridiales bacterium]